MSRLPMVGGVYRVHRSPPVLSGPGGLWLKLDEDASMRTQMCGAFRPETGTTDTKTTSERRATRTPKTADIHIIYKQVFTECNIDTESFFGVGLLRPCKSCWSLLITRDVKMRAGYQEEAYLIARWFQHTEIPIGSRRS